MKFDGIDSLHLGITVWIVYYPLLVFGSTMPPNLEHERSSNGIACVQGLSKNNFGHFVRQQQTVQTLVFQNISLTILYSYYHFMRIQQLELSHRTMCCYNCFLCHNALVLYNVIINLH